MRASSSNRGGLCAQRVAGRPLAQTAPVRGSGQTHMRVPSQAQGADTPLHIAGLARACRLRAALTGYRLRAACRTNRRKKDHHLTMAGARAIWATEGAGATAPFRHPRAMACRFRLPLRCPIGSVRSAIAQMQARQAPLCLRAISARATGIRRPRAFLASPGRTPLPTAILLGAILPGAMLQLQLMLQLPVTRMPAILVLFTSKPMKASRRLIDASNGRFGAAAAVSVMAVEEARIQWHGRMARASRSHLRPHDSEPQSLHKVNACVYCPSCILVGTSVRSRVYGSSARGSRCITHTGVGSAQKSTRQTKLVGGLRAGPVMRCSASSCCRGGVSKRESCFSTAWAPNVRPSEHCRSACAKPNCSACSSTFFVPAVACALEPFHVLLCWDIPQHDGLGEA